MRSIGYFVLVTVALPWAVQANPVIYVAPSGQDSPSSGTETQPFRTITAALRTNPTPGVVIQLAPGNYTADSGETFPLQLPRGVVLRGNEQGKGQGVVISGGGFFVSPTFARQNVAILANDNAQIRGITLVNNAKRGYGVWVESAQNVAIVNNTFTDTAHDGVFLTGKASANILGNVFTKNRASGLSAVGESTGEIRENIFEDTGFGLSVGQKSAVTIVNNRIINNRAGIVLSNLATPKIRGNLIANSREDGLVILKDRSGQPNPDLGTAADPGGNVFQNNRQRDINNASGVTLSAFGNQLDPQKVLNVSLSGTLAPTPSPSVPLVVERPSAPPQALPPTAPAVRPPSSSAGGVFRFRVFVPIESADRTAQLRRLVPDAFVTMRNGRRVFQVGAYRDRSEADAQAQRLREAGFISTIEGS
ncbi:MAG: DUF1565 domain-containing protein [Pseudanabaenaceae cyanobacterium SKYGB_i_bin29]|nr:DUF1565 domain-containing protein [Pseudanabaenaceae cyanobacterium SKYG29]MDW8421842.1 DUF1565 domain-containing protein [Pseudanabaenaceae cyanobacterium SKYGB_i_bin29]